MVLPVTRQIEFAEQQQPVTKYILIWLSCLICEQYKYWSDILSVMVSSLDTHGRSRNRSPWFPGTLCRRPLWTAVLTYTYRAGTPAVTADRSLCWPLSSLWTASGSPKSEEEENGILKHHIPILWSCSVHKLLGDDEYHFFSNNKNFALKMHLHVHVLAHAQDNAYIDIQQRLIFVNQIWFPNMLNELSTCISLFSDLWSIWQLIADHIYLFLFTQVTLIY